MIAKCKAITCKQDYISCVCGQKNVVELAAYCTWTGKYNEEYCKQYYWKCNW